MRRAVEFLLWPILLVIGAIIYAVTKSFFMGAFLCLVRAAWPVVRSWRVIRAVDPSPRRRRVLFLFYFASAGWRAAASAAVLIFLFILLDVHFGQKVDRNHLGVALFSLLGGVLLNTVIGLLAIIYALMRQQRVWVNPMLFKIVTKWARTKDETEFSRPRSNYAIFVIGTAVALPSVLPGLVLLSFVGEAGQARYVTYGFVLLLVGVVVAIVSYSILSYRIVARTPDDCWPEGFFSAQAKP